MLTDRSDKELQGFQHSLLKALLGACLVFSGLFVIGDVTKINVVGSPQLEVTVACIVGCIAMLIALVRRPILFRPIAALLMCQTFVLFTSAFIFVPQDELRIVWYFLLIGGGYILLGSRAGIAATVLSITLLISANPLLVVPYSHNAVVTCSLALALNGVLFHIFSSFSSRLYQRLRTLARNDPLTGLLNSRAYYDLCDSQIRTSKRSSDHFSILFVDLDYFKRINDEYGHKAGDKVLRVVADCLTKMKRQSDLLARVGGEEFSFFLPQTGLAGAMQLAERIREAIEEIHPQVNGKTRLTLTASIGVAQHQGDRWSMEEIEREADQAMYQAKRLGRNQVAAFVAASEDASVTGRDPAVQFVVDSVR